MHFKVFQGTRGAEEVVCEGGAADVVGQMCLKLVFFGDAGVDVAASSYMQPSQEGFYIEKEKEWGEGASLIRASLYWYTKFDLCRPLKEARLGWWHSHRDFDSIYGVSQETEVIHYPEHAIGVSGIES